MSTNDAVGGNLRDVNPAKHVVYARQPGGETCTLDASTKKGNRWTLPAVHGQFTVEVDADGKTDPTFNITYKFKPAPTPSTLAYTLSKGRAAFLRVVRTGHNKGLDTDLTTLVPQAYLRTDGYAGYRVHRINFRSPFSGQKDPNLGADAYRPFQLDEGDFINTATNSREASEVGRPELLNKMMQYKSLFFRFEAISAVLDLDSGEIVDAVEWGAHVERQNVEELGTCTVYAPSLLNANASEGSDKLKEGAEQRCVGMKLAMALWNNDYALFVDKLFTEPRFMFLASLDSLATIKKWNNDKHKIIAIPGETTQWVYPTDLLTRYSAPNLAGGRITVSPAERPLALDPLPVPQTPPQPQESCGTLYTISVTVVSAELKRLNLEPKRVVSTTHPIWLAAKDKVERSGKKATDWTVMITILDLLNERFETAAKAARRRLDPPPTGYLARGHKWLYERYGDKVGTAGDREDASLTSIQKDDLVGLILREMHVEDYRAVAKLLQNRSVTGIIEVCDALWQVYTVECGPEGSIKKYSNTLESHAPRWFRHLQSNMHWFYRDSESMMDPDDDPDGSQSDPLPSPQPRGFVSNGIGFIVDGRSIDLIQAAKGIVPAVQNKPPSFKMSAEQADEAERLHPRWAYLTHLAGGNAFFRRDDYEFDYQTAVVVTRSPAGTFRFLREKGFLYAVEVPSSGVDLEAAQRYMAAVTQDQSKISRVGEKAYPTILHEKFLASIAVETARLNTANYPSFYRYDGDWSYTRFAQKRETRDYISSALPPPLLPIPLCCYEGFLTSFMKVKFEDDPIHVGAVVGVPLHVWNDLKVVHRRSGVDQTEQTTLSNNPLLAIDPKHTANYQQVQNSPLLLAESQRRLFVASVETSPPANTVKRLQHLTEYPERLLSSDQMASAKRFLRGLKEKGEPMTVEELNKRWESVCGPRLQVDGFVITPGFSSAAPDISVIKRKYFKPISRMLDPEVEAWVIVDHAGTEVRWPVSPRPGGFREKRIAFFVARPSDFTKEAIYPEFSAEGRLSDAWSGLAIQSNDFIWNHRQTSLIPEACILVSRTFEGAVMTAKPNNVLTYDIDKSTSARVYAARLDASLVAFDREWFQLDEVAFSKLDIGHDAQPGVKALGLHSSIKKSSIFGSIPIQRLDMDAPPNFRSVTTYGAGDAAPKNLPALFQVRLLQSFWDLTDKARADDSVYLNSALPKTWLPSLPVVDGRVHSRSAAAESSMPGTK